MNTQETAAQAAAELLRSGNYSDLTLKFNGRSWAVHRAIVCIRSPVIAAACDSIFAEGKTGVIEIQAPTARADAIQRMLTYLYTHEYDDEVDFLATDGHGTFNPDVNACLIVNAKVYGLANYYQIADLKSVAEDKFRSRLYCSQLEKTAQTALVDNFAPVIFEVYDHTADDDPLRIAVVKHVSQIREEFVKHKESFKKSCENLEFLRDFSATIIGDSIGHSKAPAQADQELDTLETSIDALGLRRWCSWRGCGRHDLIKLVTHGYHGSQRFYAACRHCGAVIDN